MKILLLNPPHPAIGSRMPREHLPPLGLLSLGGPLLDAGHEVKLIDAEFGPMPMGRVVSEAVAYNPDAMLLGHSGSTSGHPSARRVIQAVRRALPQAWIIYGGVFPTYHWAQIMQQEPAIDFIVRGEGEETIVRLMDALQRGECLEKTGGIVFRTKTVPGPRRFMAQSELAAGLAVATAPAPVIRDLDNCRVGWELIDHARYTYYGKRRAVVVQFSRGCPHHCHYCGQHGFWRTWRHRDPVKFAAELARLHREQGVELINLADENPTADREAWKAFLEALITQNVPLVIIGTTRASDIVRDADILHLYRKHQILQSARIPNWRVLIWVKLIEAICQLRPKALIRLLIHPDPLLRAGMRWYSNIGRRVWIYEIWQWLFFDRRVRYGPTVGEFLKSDWRLGRAISTRPSTSYNPSTTRDLVSCSSIGVATMREGISRASSGGEVQGGGGSASPSQLQHASSLGQKPAAFTACRETAKLRRVEVQLSLVKKTQPLQS